MDFSSFHEARPPGGRLEAAPLRASLAKKAWAAAPPAKKSSLAVTASAKILKLPPSSAPPPPRLLGAVHISVLYTFPHNKRS